MAKSKNKYYVVWNGKQNGIYDNWPECKEQIQGFENAKYKSYPTEQEAIDAYNKPFPKTTKSKKKVSPKSNTKPILNSIAVDAACSGATGDMEYQGINLKDGNLLFRKGVYKDGTNNVGEFLAIVHALALSEKNKFYPPIYSDSKTAMSWVKKGKTKTTLKATERNKELFELIARAEKWLAENKIQNEILKWDTKSWGENPADFGRK